MPPEKPQWAELFTEVVTSGLCTGCSACVISCPYDVLGYDDADGVYKPFHVAAEGGPDGDPRAVATRAGFDIANEARRAGLSAQLELAGRSLKGQLKHADRLGARYVAIVSDDEHASLKNMESGDQIEIKRGAVVAAVLRGERL